MDGLTFTDGWPVGRVHRARRRARRLAVPWRERVAGLAAGVPLARPRRPLLLGGDARVPRQCTPCSF